MGNTIHDVHMKWVAKLLERGEKVLQPEGIPMNIIQGYIKSEKSPRNIGAIFCDKNGEFGLFGDFGAIHIEGIAWENLGLCDSRCWYEWGDNRKEKLKDDNNIASYLQQVDKILKEMKLLNVDLIKIRDEMIKKLEEEK
jgi:hypothetical protein